MERLRTIPRFVCVLVALFMAAQFAGVVSSPLALATENPTAAVSPMQHHHMDARDMGAHVMDASVMDAHDMDGHGGDAKSHSHGDRSADHHADFCCGLHAFFAGVLPAVIAVEATGIVGQRFAVGLADIASGIDPRRLDRPPRPRAAI